MSRNLRPSSSSSSPSPHASGSTWIKVAGSSSDHEDADATVATVDDDDDRDDDDDSLRPKTFDELMQRFGRYPTCAADFERYGNSEAFCRYVLMANISHSERNAWLIFHQRCLEKPDQPALIWLNQHGAVDKRWTYHDLLQRTRRVAHYLHTELGLARNDRAVLCFVPGLDFFVAFWACLALGVVAVPVCPPDPFQPRSDVTNKLAAIVRNAQPRAILTTSEYTIALEAAKSYLGSARAVSTAGTSASTSTATTGAMAASTDEFDLFTVDFRCIDEIGTAEAQWKAFEFPTAGHHSNGYTLAFLQYTSGSTGDPKGVMVGHCHLVRNAVNCVMTTRAHHTFELYSKTVGVSWLPTFHDMGLVGFHVAPMLFGSTVVYFSPLDFLRDPLLWPRALSEWSNRDGFRYVMTGGPTFALELCAKRIAAVATSASGAGAAKAMDLSRVISIIVGAEPIRLSSLRLFATAYAPHNFSANSFVPAYGLAENVLHAMSKRGTSYPPNTVFVDMDAMRDGRFVEVSEGDARGRWLVSSGEWVSQDPDDWPGLGVDGTVVIVDPKTMRECEDSSIGELWLHGRSNTAGYWNNPDATSATFIARLKGVTNERTKPLAKKTFIRTGDLGAIHAGQLYVTGRLKEMIIVNGANFYPTDIEECMRASHPAVRPGSIVAFSLTVDGLERMAAIVELHPKDGEDDGGNESVDGESKASSNGALQRRKSSGKVSTGGFSKAQIDMAAHVLKGAQALPVGVRGPVIRGLARLGAWLQTPRAATPSHDRKRGATAAAGRPARDADDADEGSATLTGVDDLDDAQSLDDNDGEYSYSKAELDAIDRKIKTAVLSRFGVPLSELVLVKAKTILKTSSGKVRRAATAELLEKGMLGQQILRRTLSSSAVASTMTMSRLADDVETARSEGASRSATSVKRVIERARAASVASKVDAWAPSATSSASSSSSSASVPPKRRAVLTVDVVKQQVVQVIASELQMDPDTILAFSESFEFDEEKTLDEYGLDSLTAMRIASRLTATFDLRVPLSPFMFFAEPTLLGVCRTIIRLNEMEPASVSASAASMGAASMGAASMGAASMGAASMGATSAAAHMQIGHDNAELVHATSSSQSPPGVASAASRPAESITPSSACVLGIGCAVPGPGAPQEAIMSVMVSDMELGPRKRKLFQKIGEGSGIHRRYSCLPSIDGIYYGRTGVGNNEPIETRNAIFKREAPRLSLQAAERAISDWGGDKSTITHVVAVTCTGIIVPGLEFHLMQDLGLRADTQRLSIQFMGCFGAVSGIKAAKAFAMEKPTNRVLLCCTELCSLHMQLDDRVDNMVGSALFGDGSGALVIGQPLHAGERVAYEIHHSASLIIPHTLDMMGWELTNSGMSIGLAKEIPTQIYEHIDAFVRQLLAPAPDAFRTPFKEMKWAIHPGGPMIIQAICDRLGLREDDVEPVWEVLRKYGNMSSCTLIFVLHTMRAHQQQQQQKQLVKQGDGKWVPMLAFGPGLNVEGSLLRMP